ncbi:ABC transporter permease [Pseudarthrobacter sp. J1738]|uniref:ABC transporter permease n=1 Tax=unclassified Pseudarthrobacter TaxID=2647000 RepID=UPI003D2C2C6D
MNSIIANTITWLTDPEHWTGITGIPVRIGEHLQYSALVLLIAAVIAIPVGMYVGHTGKGRVVVVAVAGSLRALPTLGLLILFVLLAGIGLMPPIWALVILTVPPLLSGTYAGISSVDRQYVDAARAMGMTEWQILFQVEVPNAVKVMLGGFRTAVLQVIATVSVVAYINLGGLGRYIFDGADLNDFPRMLGGSLLITLLAIAADLVLVLLQRLLTPRGLRATTTRSGTAGNTAVTRATTTTGVTQGAAPAVAAPQGETP